jgi:hypothetical protein
MHLQHFKVLSFDVVGTLIEPEHQTPDCHSRTLAELADAEGRAK